MRTIAIDTETVSLTNKTLVAFSWSDGKKTVSVPVRMNTTKNMPIVVARVLLQGLILNNKIIFHNSSFDIPVLAKFGIAPKLFTDVEDTVIIANMVNENIQHGLKKLVKSFLGIQMKEYKEVCGSGKKQVAFADVPWKEAEMYSKEDAYFTYKIYGLLYPRLLQDGKLFKLYNEVEKPLLLTVADMHINGVTINAKRIKEISDTCQKKIRLTGKKLQKLMGRVIDFDYTPKFKAASLSTKEREREWMKQFLKDKKININSTKQLRAYFITLKNMPEMKFSKKTHAPAVDKEVLEIYAETNKEAKLLLEYRKYAKTYSTFIPALTPKEYDLDTWRGKIYASFNQAGTTSGRFSSSRPNLQNIPIHGDEFKIRGCIIADEGQILIGADYSQIELRVLAHFSKDKNLMKAYQEGLDIHQQTADACGVPRAPTAKTINFGLVYGMGAKTLSKRIECNVEQARQYMNKYFTAYPGVKIFWKEAERSLKERGYTETFFGRKRRRTIFFWAKDTFDQGSEIRSAINAVIQGTSADLMKIAMVAMFPQLQKVGARIISTVHDEVIVSCPKNKAEKAYHIIVDSMLDAGKDLAVPIGVDCKFGRTWEEAHGDDGVKIKDLKKWLVEVSKNDN
jgi:DNA polymerase-1